MPRLRERRRLKRNTNSFKSLFMWAPSTEPWCVPGLTLWVTKVSSEVPDASISGAILHRPKPPRAPLSSTAMTVRTFLPLARPPRNSDCEQNLGSWIRTWAGRSRVRLFLTLFRGRDVLISPIPDAPPAAGTQQTPLREHAGPMLLELRPGCYRPFTHNFGTTRYQ